MLRPEGGGGKHNFFSFHICDRAAEDKQVEKNGSKSDCAFLRYCMSKSEVYLQLLVNLELKTALTFLSFLSIVEKTTLYSLTLRIGKVVSWTCILKSGVAIYLI